VISRIAEPDRQVMKGGKDTGYTTLATAAYSIGQPTDEEQYYLELINRARANPTAEGVRLATATDPDVANSLAGYSVDLAMLQSEFAALPVRPPLAMNQQLMNAARGHSQNMFNLKFQGHYTNNNMAAGGPGTRATAAGYNFTSLGENVYAYARNVFHGHAGFQVDWGADEGGSVGGMQSNRGHRMNVHGDFREVGIGVVNGSNAPVGPQLVTQDFGISNTGTAFVTGVAYYDLNGNNFYDPGEGVGGLTVDVQGASFHGITANSGGYAVPVPTVNATRAVTFSGLSMNGDGSAVIAGQSNAKVDLKAAYVAPVVSGPAAPVVGDSTPYAFTAVGGATGYEWRRVIPVAAAADGAENLNRITVTKTGTYGVLSTAVKQAGNSSFRLAHPSEGNGAPADQIILYNARFLVGAAASVNFQSRLSWSGDGESAKVQVSTNNGVTWADVYSQTGSGDAGEGAFAARAAPLTAYQGQEVQLRFVYVYDFANSFYSSTSGPDVGWFIDSISFTNVTELTNPVIAATPGGSTFSFAPPSAGSFLLSVRPVVGGRPFPFGAPLAVDAMAGPEITVEQPAGTGLTDGASTVAFGAVTLGMPVTRTFTVRNDGVLDLTGLAVTLQGSADFITGGLAVASLAPNESATFDVTFTPSAAGVRTAVLRVPSNDANENPFDISLSGSGDAKPVISGPAPSAEIRQVGGAQVVFSVSAAPAPVTIQWRKNGAAIAGATADSLAINAPTLAHAGAYSVVIKRGSLSTTSAAAQLGVVDNTAKVVAAPVNGATQLTVAAAGNGLKFKWRRNLGGIDQDLPAFSRFKGIDTKTLSISGLLAGDSAEYFCEVSNTGGMVEGGTTELRVFGSVPVIDAFAPPNGIVGGPYSYKVIMNAGVDVTPTSYAATNVPPGLKLDTKTGVISGRPTKDGSFEITFTAANSIGKSIPKKATVTIALFPPDLAGVYTGWIERSALNGNLGGRIDLTVTSTGAYTGSLTMGVTKYPLKGNLDIDVGAKLPRSEVQVKRSGNPVPDPLALVLEMSANAFTANSAVTADGDSAAITGWRQVWHATKSAATPYLGYYTAVLRLGAVDPDAPQGSGYGSFTVAKDGKLTFAGKAADGEAISCATFVGPTGQIAFFQPLYAAAAKGSILGQAQIALGADLGISDDNTLSGSLDWNRRQNLKVRTYAGGFGMVTPVPLSAIGGRYIDAGAIILGLNSGDEATLSFLEGGLGASRRNPDINLTIGDKNKLLLQSSEAFTKLTVAVPNGVISGSFILDDPDPSKPPPAKEVILKRTVNFHGVLVNDGGTQVGEGLFLLPQLPDGVTTPTTSPILSGKVVLEKAP
jgi:hypothetical protein